MSTPRAQIVDHREMPTGRPRGHTGAMTIRVPISRLTLIPGPRAETPGATVVRRYRLSRVRLNGRPSPDRHAHLKRTYD